MRLCSAVVIAGLLTHLGATEQNRAVQVPMRDGVRLATSVFLPDKPGRCSTLLLRTPYNKGNHLLSGYKAFLERGYAVVLQDVRGRYSSGGTFRPPVQETNDGDDTLNWIARQPWSDGKVGMIGGSYVGIVQWRAALAHNPHLIAIFPVVAGVDEYRDRFYSRGGALKLGHRLNWIAENLKLPWPFRPDFKEYVRHLPLRTSDRVATGHTVDFWQEALDHPARDDYWRSRSTLERIGEIRTPAFIVGGWYDNYVESDLEAFAALSRYSTAHRLLIGPWPHNQSAPFPSGITFGPDAVAPIRRHQLDWFDHWMRAVQPPEDFRFPRVRIFVMGVDKWRDEEEWPLARTRYTSFYLDSTLGANSLRGDGRLLPEAPAQEDLDTWINDPGKPVPTMGGALCCDPKAMPWGPMDQREVEVRDDVLVYTSAPLKHDLEVTGSVRVALYVSSSAPDTDFTAKLVDVYPDGKARNLCDGILRLRYRDGPDRAVLAKPGVIYPVIVQAGVTSNVFRAGHRIRLEIAGTNFPRFDRNSNTGGTLATETVLRKAAQTVHHGRNRPSRLILPVIPQRTGL